MPGAGSSGQVPVLLRTLLLQQEGKRVGAVRRPKRKEQPGTFVPGCFFVCCGFSKRDIGCTAGRAAQKKAPKCVPSRKNPPLRSERRIAFFSFDAAAARCA